jgi:antitoxin (DNA-binding transcriptional repressor) of toxin-antitoxin stability system
MAWKRVFWCCRSGRTSGNPFDLTVNRVDIHDAKTNLSRYLAELKPGETLVLCNGDQPVAELRSLRKKAVGKPRIGVAKGEFAVPDSFFEPLPDEILKAFKGL